MSQSRTKELAEALPDMEAVIDAVDTEGSSSALEPLLIERGACDLNEIVRHVIEEAESAHPGQVFHVDEASNARGTWDRDRLSQLLSNLVRNALEHGSSGTPVGI